MQKYGMERRQEFESRIPSLGDALEMIERAVKKRVWDETREERAALEAERMAELFRNFEEEREAAYQARKANPVVPATPRQQESDTRPAWERLGVSKASYEADCERKRGLAEQAKAEAA